MISNHCHDKPHRDGVTDQRAHKLPLTANGCRSERKYISYEQMDHMPSEAVFRAPFTRGWDGIREEVLWEKDTRWSLGMAKNGRHNWLDDDFIYAKNHHLYI